MPSPTSATIHPDSGLRHYTFNDQQLISVTSMRRVVGMPFPLAAWQVNQVIKAASLMRGTMVEKSLSEEEYPKRLRQAATQERDTAAALGSSVHEAADQGIRSADLPDGDDRKPFLAQYEAWQRAMRPDILLSESQVFNFTEGYAGSLDLVADIGQHLRRRWLVDLKTGKGVYSDHAIQLALYMAAEAVGGFDPIEQQDVVFPEATSTFRDCEGMAILHLRPEGWSFIEIPYTDRLAAAALDMVRLARFFTENPDIENLKGATYP